MNQPLDQKNKRLISFLLSGMEKVGYAFRYHSACRKQRRILLKTPLREKNKGETAK